MLGACAHVSTLPQAPEPKVVIQTVAVPVCPAEATAVPAPQPAVPADAVITANASGQDWLSQVLAWGQGLFANASDAKAACAKEVK